MNFLNLEYFVRVADCKNITRAAAELFISQQTLSAHIASLENKLGTPLFVRSTPLKLTYPGTVLLRYARECLRLNRDLYREFEDILQDRKGQLSIGIALTRGRILLPDILHRFLEAYPQVEVRVMEASNDELGRALLEEKIDLMIARLPSQRPGIAWEHFYSEEAVLLVPDAVLRRQFGGGWRETAARLEQGVDLRLLRECPFLLNREGEIIRSVADRMFSEAGVTPHVAVETQNIETLLGMVVRGMGIAFYPDVFLALAWPNGLPEGIRPFRLGRREAVYALGFGYLQRGYLSRTVRGFMEAAREVAVGFGRQD